VYQSLLPEKVFQFFVAVTHFWFSFGKLKKNPIQKIDLAFITHFWFSFGKLKKR